MSDSHSVENRFSMSSSSVSRASRDNSVQKMDISQMLSSSQHDSNQEIHFESPTSSKNKDIEGITKDLEDYISEKEYKYASTKNSIANLQSLKKDATMNSKISANFELPLPENLDKIKVVKLLKNILKEPAESRDQIIKSKKGLILHGLIECTGISDMNGENIETKSSQESLEDNNYFQDNLSEIKKIQEKQSIKYPSKKDSNKAQIYDSNLKDSEPSNFDFSNLGDTRDETIPNHKNYKNGKMPTTKIIVEYDDLPEILLDFMKEYLHMKKEKENQVTTKSIKKELEKPYEEKLSLKPTDGIENHIFNYSPKANSIVPKKSPTTSHDSINHKEKKESSFNVATKVDGSTLGSSIYIEELKNPLISDQKTEISTKNITEKIPSKKKIANKLLQSTEKTFNEEASSINFNEDEEIEGLILKEKARYKSLTKKYELNKSKQQKAEAKITGLVKDNEHLKDQISQHETALKKLETQSKKIKSHKIKSYNAHKASLNYQTTIEQLQSKNLDLLTNGYEHAIVILNNLVQILESQKSSVSQLTTHVTT